MQKTGICIITKNRTERVLAVLQGIEMNTQKPAEVLVIHMNEDAGNYPRFLFPVHAFAFKNAHPLPLAAARNYAAKKASCPNLIFLDADCIPSEKLIENYTMALKDDVLLAGNVRYLPADFTPGKNLHENSIAHPNRRLNSGPINYELFWSLNFACTKTTFNHIGGFDETFTGYGAEDTDFAFSARKKSIPFIFAEADVYHQYHPTFRPPLNHLKSIIENAAIFHAKWSVWPMQDWLNDFEKMGFIRFRTNSIELLKEPLQDEIAATENKNPAGF